MFKRIISFVLCVSMLASLGATTILASETSERTEDSVASVSIGGVTTYFNCEAAGAETAAFEQAWEACKGQEATLTLLTAIEANSSLKVGEGDDITIEMEPGARLTRDYNVFEVNGGSLRLESGEVYSPNGDTYYGAAYMDGGRLEIGENGYIRGSGVAILCGGPATVVSEGTIEGGTYGI